MTDQLRQNPAGENASESRKAEHLSISTTRPVENGTGAGWDGVALVHRCLPEVDLDGVDLSTELLGKRLWAPVVIAALTGGAPDALEINRRLGRAAQRFGIAMGVGSQRGYLEGRDSGASFAVVREEAPDILLIANLGAPQLIPQRDRAAIPPEVARRAVELISADALAVHMNFLQEAVQPEGNTRAAGCADAIGHLVAELGLPVVAKETGGGIAREEALLLAARGVAALDVGGAGGTSMPMVESYRSAARGRPQLERLARTFRDWGTPTAMSLLECSAAGIPLIATGGVRDGLEAAKALALGATAVGVALPLLRAAAESYDSLEEWLEGFLLELRTAMFLSGASSCADLRAERPVLLGRVREWADQRGL